MDEEPRLQFQASNSRSFLANALTKINIGGRSSDDQIGSLGLNTLSTPAFGTANADLIFVHGLGGGSRKTWTKSGDPSLYWPEEWLPYDQACQDVRIHSFGYDSSWGKKSILSVHDFANALLGSILDCPLIPRDTESPIVLVGHSMGGLVIKRMYLLAKAKQEFASVAARIQGMLFLATPHRGSDMAQVLSNLLKLMPGQRPFVTDLKRDSHTMHTINDEFPELCQGLLLYSFYETRPTSFKVKSTLIVERDLATMGYANERRGYLDADHRGVCKFTSQNEPNYRTVRNALAWMLDVLRSRYTMTKQTIGNQRRRQLDNLLGVSDAPEDDFLKADGLRMDGSVEWLIQKESFQEWLHYTDPPIYCITAKPATGKTVLTGKVVAHLRKMRKCCSFFFFRYDTTEKANIRYFLLSMAWQMAQFDERIMTICLEILERSDQSKSDYRTIWRKLFLEGIFKITFENTQYWVIDALDECKNEPEIIVLLMNAAEVSSLHILLTSRNRFETRQKLGDVKVRVLPEEIQKEDSRSDIRMYLDANADALPSVDEHGEQDTVRQILDKSRGCFLWVSLVVQELRDARTSADKRKILDEVPPDMNDLYARILNTMSQASHGKELAKAILDWTVCSRRPLKISELHEALELDLKSSVDSVEKSIRSCCGQLVYVDAKGEVQMTHLTARDFLLNPTTTSEFAITEKHGHRRLLLTCLQYLHGDESKGPRRRSSGNSVPKVHTPFNNYASESLGEHIAHLSWMDREILSKLAKFFRSSNVLSWIEQIAKQADQQRLVEVGKSLVTFLQGSPDHTLPSSADFALLSSWATDLVRLVMQFGKNLEAYPPSIFRLIAPFCPTETALRKQFGSGLRDISVCGLRAETWDDCLGVIVDTHQQYSSLACSKTQFAIGCYSGKISLLKQATCQEIAVLDHGEPVRFLRFGAIRNILVSAGSKTIRVWDLASKEQLRVFDAPQQCMAITFEDEDRLLLAAMKDHCLKYWDLENDDVAEDINWTRGLEAMTIRLFRRPATAAFGMDSDLLAVIYKGQDILLWGLDTGSLYKLYSRESGPSAESNGRQYGSSGVRCLVFGNAANSHLLACAYTDGELVLFDTSTDEVKKRVVIFAHILACSPDGSMLASADPSGTIQLFHLETVQLLYRISSVEPGIQDLAFSQDGLRLFDIRGSRCRVWDLTHLARQNAHESIGDVMLSVASQDLEHSDNGVLITSVACLDAGNVFFAGKEDGSVYVYDIDTGLQTRELFSHAHGISIVYLHYEGQSRTITSVDSSSRIMIHRLDVQSRNLTVTEILFDYRTYVAVGQVLYQPGLQRVLVCSAISDILWSLGTGGKTLLTTIKYEDREPYRWATHPSIPDQLILMTEKTAHIYDWKTLDRLTEEAGITLEAKIPPDLSIRSITPCFDGNLLAVMLSESNRPHSASRLVLWNASDFALSSKAAVPAPCYSELSLKVEVLIGTSGYNPGSERLVFLDDNQWVCSTDVQAARSSRFVRHFFFPAGWLNTRKNLDLSVKVTKGGEVILVRDDEVAVVKRGLITSEHLGDGDALPTTPSPPIGRRGRKTSFFQGSFGPYLTPPMSPEGSSC